jgi:ABC-type iron transport system FetAB ATPase subunit
VSALEFRSLATRFVGPIDLSIAAGECVALTGESGSGKTLLLRAAADLDPHRGDAYLDGESCAAMPAWDWRRRVGLLPTESAWWYERVGEHFSDSDCDSIAALGLSADLLEANVSRLSTGERQRLALARLLARAPRALLLDEPTASLDPDNTRRVEKLIERYRSSTSAPVLWVSHDPVQAERIGDRTYRLVCGRLSETS